MKAESLKMSTMNRRMNRDNIYSGMKLCDRAQWRSIWTKAILDWKIISVVNWRKNYKKKINVVARIKEKSYYTINNNNFNPLHA